MLFRLLLVDNVHLASDQRTAACIGPQLSLVEVFFGEIGRLIVVKLLDGLLRQTVTEFSSVDLRTAKRGGELHPVAVGELLLWVELAEDKGADLIAATALRVDVLAATDKPRSQQDEDHDDAQPSHDGEDLVHQLGEGGRS